MTLLVGIGDLHLDGPLCKIMDDANSKMLYEVGCIIEKGYLKGATGVVLYGDICHRSRLSEEALRGLLSLIAQYSEDKQYKMEFYILKGNHDHESNEENALQTLAHMCALKILRRTTIALNKSITVYPNGGTRGLRLCPWPNTDVSTKAAYNVVHVETKGTTFDNGREVPAEHTHVLDKVGAKVLGGHMHTGQVTNEVDFVGTPYQTTFAEQPTKYWHLIDLEKGTHKRIKHKPQFELRTIVVESRAEVKALPTPAEAPGLLIRLLVKNGIDISTVVLHDNVVKHTGFKDSKELKTLIEDGDLDMADEDALVVSSIDPQRSLADWLNREKVSPSLQKKVLDLNKRFTTPGGSSKK